jgi:hypothetical protein
MNVVNEFERNNANKGKEREQVLADFFKQYLEIHRAE